MIQVMLHAFNVHNGQRSEVGRILLAETLAFDDASRFACYFDKAINDPGTEAALTQDEVSLYTHFRHAIRVVFEKPVFEVRLHWK